MPIRRPDHGCHGYSSSRNSVLWAFSSLVVQHDQAPRLNRIQATSTRGIRARIRRAAGCATPTGSAGHAGATANLKLTFHLDHSAGADQWRGVVEGFEVIFGKGRGCRVENDDNPGNARYCLLE